MIRLGRRKAKQILPHSLQTRVILGALLVYGLSLVVSLAAAVDLVRQESLKYLETEMHRTASGVIELLAEAAAPLRDADGSRIDELSPEILEARLAPMRRVYMTRETKRFASVNIGFELTCVLAGSQLQWMSTGTPSQAQQDLCKNVPPLSGDCTLSFGTSPESGFTASRACLVEDDEGYELRRKVRLGRKDLWTIRVLANKERYNEEVTDRLLFLSRVPVIQILVAAIIGACLIWFGLRHQLKPIRQLGKQLLLPAPEESKRESQFPNSMSPEVQSIYDSVARSRTDLLMIRQQFLSLAVSFGHSMRRAIGEAGRYWDAAEKGGALTGGSAGDMQGIHSRAMGLIDGFLDQLAALNEQRLSPENRETAIHIDVCALIEQEIDNVTWVAGEKIVDFPKKTDAVWISGLEVAARPFQTIMFELIKRAFQNSRQTVKIRVEQANDTVCISIEDDDLSQPKESRDKLLAWGARANTVGQIADGDTDLVAVQRLLVAMRGEIQLQDSELGGVRLVVELPAHRREEGWEPPQGENEGPTVSRPLSRSRR